METRAAPSGPNLTRQNCRCKRGRTGRREPATVRAGQLDDLAKWAGPEERYRPFPARGAFVVFGVVTTGWGAGLAAGFAAGLAAAAAAARAAARLAFDLATVCPSVGGVIGPTASTDRSTADTRMSP
jgi:hypothetical protein